MAIELDLFSDYLPGIDPVQVAPESSAFLETLSVVDAVPLQDAREPIMTATDEIEQNEVLFIDEDNGDDSSAIEQAPLEGQMAFIELTEWWTLEWQDMPEFTQQDLQPWKSVYVHFACQAEMRQFGETIGQALTNDTRSLWFPKLAHIDMSNKRFVDEA